MDNAEKYILLGVGAFFSIILLGFFTAVQNIALTFSRTKAKKFEEEGDSGAKQVLSMLADRRKLFLNTQIGKIVSFVFCSTALCFILKRYIPHSWYYYVDSYGISIFLMIVILISCLITLLGEIIPGIMDINNYKLIKRVARMYNIISMLIYPFTFVIAKFINKFIPQYLDFAVGPQELDDERDRYVNYAKEVGIIEEEEKEMISSVFEFGDTIAREVMVPRPDIVGMPINTSFDKLLEIVAEDGHSRFPVYDGSIDKIVGILYVKDVIVKLKQINDENYDLFKLLRKPFFVPETKNLNDLLRDFQMKNQHLAIVVDEYGGVSGLVSIEDLLEEIVGEIVDEYDQGEQESITKIDEFTYNVDARQSMPDLEGKLDCKFDYEDAETVGGFVMEKLGRIPIQGESFEVPQGIFTIIETKGNRILKVKITLNNSAQ